MQDWYKTIKYGRKWAVQRSDGTLRCVVEDEHFARQICKECNNSERDLVSVVCVDTGKRYATLKEACQDVGLKNPTSISKAISKHKRAAGHEWRYERWSPYY